jgi:hypothetical protein
MSAWPGNFVIGLTGNIATGNDMYRDFGPLCFQPD